MKKLLIIIAVVLTIVLTSCSATKPVYSGDMDKYHTQLQKYYKAQVK